MLVAPRGAIAAARGAAEQAFFGQYTPETNIDSIAALDIDQRSIVARVASGDEEGLVEARDVYSNGVTGSSSLTLKGLSTLADEKLKWSTTYQTFKDYYGGSGFADKLIEASFEGVEMPIGRGSFDFGYFDVEGRAGKAISPLHDQIIHSRRLLTPPFTLNILSHDQVGCAPPQRLDARCWLP